MSETRKIVAILAADVVGFGRLAGADEERTLARLRALRSDLIDPTISVHRGRVVKHTGDGALVEFRSVVDAVRFAIEMQNGMVERNAGLPPQRRIDFRIGIHIGDVVEESDGDLMGDGVNIAVRLEGVAEPGGICLSEDAYRQVRDRVDAPFTDLGERTLKNIVRPMRLYKVKTSRDFPSRASAPEKPGPPHLSIVVLPFANIRGDPEQEYFVDGVTESLTTDLSRISGAFVIARNTAFTYKNKHLDVKQIGRELDVRYVLEGSVQRGRNRMRVNVEFIDAGAGNHLWADRFDKPLADLLDMQDEIVARLANALNTQLVAAEARRAEQAPHPDSMDLYFQGMAWANKGLRAEYLARAHGFFERALALDPGNVDALVGSARVDAFSPLLFTNDDRAERLAAAEATLIEALSLAPYHAWAHCMMGYVLGATNRATRAISELDRALALYPNLAMAHAWIGLAKLMDGRPEETDAHINEALRLSPHDDFTWAWIGPYRGGAKLFLGADEEAVVWLRRSIDTNRNYALAHFMFASALTHVGRLADARNAVQAGLALSPAFTIARWRASTDTDNPIFLAGREHIYDGMRKAGVPDA